MVNKDYPKISIITPSYNQGQFIEQTIRSVIDQGYPNLEYIIIDGGSTDNSIEIIRQYEKYITYWVSEQDKGQSNALNKGFKKTTGDIIGWLNSDDIYYPGSLQNAAKIFMEHPDVDIIFGDYNYIDINNNVIHIRREIQFDYNIYLWTKDCYHANCSGYFRKRCFEKYGNIKEELHYSMDYELYLRFAKNGCKYFHVPIILGAMRVHNNSKSVKGYNEQNNEAIKMLQEYILKEKVAKHTLLIRYIYYKIKRLFLKFVNGCYNESMLLLPKFIVSRFIERIKTNKNKL